MTCEHASFAVVARVQRAESGQRFCDLVVKCAQCQELFEWGAKSADKGGLRLRVHIAPSGKHDS